MSTPIQRDPLPQGFPRGQALEAIADRLSFRRHHPHQVGQTEQTILVLYDWERELLREELLGRAATLMTDAARSLEAKLFPEDAEAGR
jgi:hypothetical protein